MGEVADDMLDGTCCQVCGMFMDEAAGYPVTCGGCSDDPRLVVEVKPIKDPKTVPCPHHPACERMFRTKEAACQHWADKHG